LFTCMRLIGNSAVGLPLLMEFLGQVPIPR
jgi:hypothetical protein